MAPRLPICNFDAKTGILCANCRERLRKGEITAADVQASKAIVRLADSVSELNRITLSRAYGIRGSYLLEVGEADLGPIRSSQSIIPRLEEALGGKVWAVAVGTSERRFLEDLFFPAKVLTVNTLWLPDGGKRTKVIVPGKRGDRRFGDFDKMRDAVKQTRGIELLVETDREAGFRKYG